MKNVYVLIIEWNRHGDAGHEIFAVCGTLEKAQEFLSDEVNSDLQYGGFYKIEGFTDADLEEYVKERTPLPTKYVKMSNNEDEFGYSDDFIEYSIMETPLYE